MNTADKKQIYESVLKIIDKEFKNKSLNENAQLLDSMMQKKHITIPENKEDIYFLHNALDYIIHTWDKACQYINQYPINHTTIDFETLSNTYEICGLLLEENN